MPFRAGAAVSNVSFRDVDYHSGAPYDDTDWTGAVGGSAVDRDSPATFAQKANTNALRRGTMHRYPFQADIGPGPGVVTIGLFRPGTPGTVGGFSTLPCLVLGDTTGDGLITGADNRGYIDIRLGVAPANPCADLAPPLNGILNIFDDIKFIDALLGLPTLCQ